LKNIKDNLFNDWIGLLIIPDALYGNTGRFLSGKVELAGGDTAKGNAFQTM